jgi:hypothetical protein
MNLLRQIPYTQVTSELVVMVMCVLMGAFVLTRFTRIRGVLGFALNGLLLFAGALAADYLTRGMTTPLGYLVERTLLVSFAGMLVASILLLLLFPRHRTE